MTDEDDIGIFRERERLMKASDRIRLSGIPERFRAQGLGDYHPLTETAAALRECERYTLWFREHWREGVGMALVGEPGGTKTTLACLTALDICRVGYAVRYVTLDAYVRDLRKRIDLERLARLDSESQQALTDLAASHYREWVIRRAAYLLVLDDVGKEYRSASGFAASEYDSLVRDRYDRGLPTIVTSNMPLDDWAVEYSPAMRSFVHEMCQVILFEGFDARGRKMLRAGG